MNRAVSIVQRPRASWDRRKTDKFCRVCQRAIHRIIDLHTN